MQPPGRAEDRLGDYRPADLLHRSLVDEGHLVAPPVLDDVAGRGLRIGDPLEPAQVDPVAPQLDEERLRKVEPMRLGRPVRTARSGGCGGVAAVPPSATRWPRSGTVRSTSGIRSAKRNRSMFV